MRLMFFLGHFADVKLIIMLVQSHDFDFIAFWSLSPLKKMNRAFYFSLEL